MDEATYFFAASVTMVALIMRSTWGSSYQVSLSLLGDRSLVGSFLVFGIDLIHDVHTLRHFTERSETHRIELGIVSVVDEKLRGPAIARRGLGQ